MVCTFRILSDEEEDFLRDLEILSDQTFFDFHQALQKDLHYDPSQLASFFITDDRWERILELTLFEMDEKQEGIALMADTKISDHISGIRQKLLYQFDLFSDRVLFIELVETREPEKDVDYPRITRSSGLPPPQLLMDDLRPATGRDEDDNDLFADPDLSLPENNLF